MILQKAQIDFYRENGYLVINNLFDKSEIDTLQEDALKLNNMRGVSNIILEANGDVRSIFAPHTISYRYAQLYRQSRLVNPAKQLIGTDIYLYQYKLNNKKAFVGNWWEWHQDFPYWHLDDGVKLPEMISVMILLQDTTTIQGPLVFIPESHKHGIVDFEPKEHLLGLNSNTPLDLINSLTADIKYTIKKKIIKDMIEKCGFFEAIGLAGCCVFFHPNLFHASNVNISPYERNTAIITYNAVNNLPTGEEMRPDYICARDFSPILKTVNNLE
jgi:ectoine hydroxylase